MEDYKKLYEKEVNKKILNYDELVLKYIKLLYLYYLNIHPDYYHNLIFLKKAIIGFNYYQKQYIGDILIPNDCSIKLFHLWNKIINSNNNDLSNLEALLVISTNIINNLKNTYPLNFENISQSLILNLLNVYATLDTNNHLIRN